MQLLYPEREEFHGASLAKLFRAFSSLIFN